MQTNVIIVTLVHERYNERSFQRDHKISSGTREETNLNEAPTGNVHQVHGHASAKFTHVQRLRPKSETPPNISEPP